MSWRVLLGLLACNAIWATNPMMGKILMRDFSALQVAWFRYSSALIAVAFVLVSLRVGKRFRLSPTKEVFRPENFRWILLMGALTFFASPVLQYTGLYISTSTANALIVAMEPLFAALLAWVFLREALHWKQTISFALAIAGFFLLSNLKPGDFWGSLSLFSVGNVFLLLTMPMEAMYTIISRKLRGRLTPLTLFAWSLLFGFTVLTAYLLMQGTSLPSYRALPANFWLAILWIGPLGTTVTYVFWTIALARAPVAVVSLTLFLQPILGAVFGAGVLGERLDFWQAAGGLLILGALLLQTTDTLKEEKA